jgi:hypothetical protein
MSEILDDQSIKTLDIVNDFPHVGLIYYENSGENLLRYYLEQIFKIQTQTNIKKKFLTSPINNIFPKKDQDLNLFWVISSDYPIREIIEYEPVDISLAIILVRNPIEVIMSSLLKDALLLEEGLKKADEMINKWKKFYKYWLNAPIPCHIIKCEELIDDPAGILKDLSRFILGITSVEETKLDYAIQKVIKENIDQKYLPFNVNISMKKNMKDSITDNMLSQFQMKFTELDGLMKKFRYADDDREIEEERKEEERKEGDKYDEGFIKQFNDDNLIKSVELQENIANSILTSSYYTLRLN